MLSLDILRPGTELSDFAERKQGWILNASRMVGIKSPTPELHLVKSRAPGALHMEARKS